MMNLTLESAIDFYLADAHARRLSANTINDYQRTFKKLIKFVGKDKPITDITTNDMRLFLADFPHLKPKSICNMHAGLSALWAFWVREELVEAHIMKKIDPPKLDVVEIQPFTTAEIKLLFTAIKKTSLFKREKDSVPMSRSVPFPKRNKAILMLLLDAGPRASELCDLRFEDLDLKTQTITIKLGKGRKMRTPPFSAATAKAIMAYLGERKAAVDKYKGIDSGKPAPTDYIFINSKNKPLDRDKLWKVVADIGKRAGIDAYPHKFRHTFAIFYLKNGGNIYYLQQILGHQDLKMIKRYLAISKQDMVDAHKHFSPVANLNL